jgi:hypothetical protein
LFEQGLVAGTQYALKVRARNFFTHFYDRHEEAPWSASLIVYSSDLPQPVVALNFIDRTKTDATILWQLHSAESLKGFSTIEPYYLLWVDNCRNQDKWSLLVNSTSISEHHISSIPPGSTCRFKMNTLNIIGYSEAFSPILSVLFAELPDQPAAPEYVARQGGDSTTGLLASITVSWQAPANTGGLPILGYSVQINEGSGWKLAFDGSVDPTTKQFQFDDLVADRTYQFRVFARNQLGYSEASEATEIVAAKYPYQMDPPQQKSVVPDGLTS